MGRIFSAKAAALLAPLPLLIPANSAGKPAYRRGAAAVLPGPRTVRLTVRIRHSFAGAPLRLGGTVYRTPAGDSVTVTRLAYLISGIALLRSDGTAVPLGGPGYAAYINPAEGRDTFTLPTGAPAGHWAGLRFHIGLPPAINHASPAGYPAGHPLNPLTSGLHWGWQGGYIFLALEGGCLRPDGVHSGYSYHLATDRHRMTVMLRRPLDLRSDTTLVLGFDVAKTFGGSGAGPLLRPREADGSNSTHSRPGDPLPGRIAAEVERAFTMVGAARGVAAMPPAAASSGGAAAAAARTTPYRFVAPAGFPQPALPADNPLTAEGVALGRRLFSEKRLSGDDTQACASCHRQEAAFSDGGRALSRGIDGRTGMRNAMPLFNLAWSAGAYTWDGGKTRLRDQVLAPIQNAREMHESLPRAVAKLKADPEYPRLFFRAFGTAEVTPERIGLAVEQYLLTLVSADSKFDRALRGDAQFTDQEKRGLLLFLTEYDPSRGQTGGDCFHCHGGSLFTDYRFHNNGLEAVYQDPGRYLITHDEADRGKFKTPSLRNVALTAPYMHDGRFPTLEEVVAHYCGGVRRSATLDPNLAKHPDGGISLTSEDQAALVAFLKTLTDARFQP